MDGKRIRAFYVNATAWSFDGDAEPHIMEARERQAAEFDRWLAEVKADAWDEGHDAATDEAPDGVWPDAWIDAHNPYRQEARNDDGS